MQTRTTLLSGETLTLSTGDRTVADVGRPTRCSVLLVDGVELEVHASDPDAADFFFAATGSTAGAPLRLRGGQQLVVGAYGSRPGQGPAYRVDTGGEALFGVSPPGMGREALAAALSDAGIGPGSAGTRMRPGGRTAWSPLRSHDVAVSALAPGGRPVLLDVRRAVRPSSPGRRGRPVRGGWLSRSDPSERPHVVLETPDAVAYGLPPSDDDLDAAVAVLADLRIDVEAAP
ncbi:MAG: hypothetical protein WCA30_17035 [Dermatophilaceae bacterium]